MSSIYQEDHTGSGFLAPWGQLETHQILWPQHAHKRTQGLLPLVSWGSGMGTLGAQAGQAIGQQGAGSRTALPPHEACPQAVEMVSWRASRRNEPLVGHRRKVLRNEGQGGGGPGQGTAAQSRASPPW